MSTAIGLLLVMLAGVITKIVLMDDEITELRHRLDTKEDRK